MPAKQKIFVPVSVEEMPPKEGEYFIEMVAKGESKVEKDICEFHRGSFVGYNYNRWKIIHWLEEKEGYFLSQEELDREVEKRVHEKLKSYIKP